MSIDSEALRRYLMEQEQASQPMSQQDQVVIRQSKPDAPGVYVSTEQQQQDAYNRELLQRQALAAQRMQNLPRYTEQVDTSMGNPNFRVAEERQMTVDDNGNIIIY